MNHQKTRKYISGYIDPHEMELIETHRKWILVLLGIFLLISMSSTVDALIFDFEDGYLCNVHYADLIVYGTLSHVKCVIEPIHGRIITIGDLNILEIIKQKNNLNYTVGDSIVFFNLGGTVGDRTDSVEDIATTQTGEGPFPAEIHMLKRSDTYDQYIKGMYFIYADVSGDYSQKARIEEILNRNLTSEEQKYCP
jgi:hypothetical protein